MMAHPVPDLVSFGQLSEVSFVIKYSTRLGLVLNHDQVSLDDPMRAEDFFVSESCWPWYDCDSIACFVGLGHVSGFYD